MATRLRQFYPSCEVRAAKNGGMPTLYGHFAVFGVWTEIDSVSEGRFRERISRGAFKRTLAEDTVKVLFQHGKDPQIGDRPIGIPTVLREDDVGAYYEVKLIDAPYVREILPGLELGAYGSSFRFQAMLDEWDPSPGRSDENPEGLPERTLLEARVYELSPVTWPAYEKATAGVRGRAVSLTDWFLGAEDFVSDPIRAWTPAARRRALLTL